MCCPTLRPTPMICGVVLLSLTGCYSLNGYVMNAAGHGYYQQGNYALAAQQFQTAMLNSPGNPDYIANLAKARMKLGDHAGAEQLYRQALTQTPGHQPSYHGYSELLLAQGRGQEALSMVNTWSATQPYLAEPHIELAWLQKELGQADASALSLQRALQVNPSHATALAHLGQHYEETGQPAQAITMYQHSLQSDWNQPVVQSRLAVAAGQVGAGHPMSEIAMSRGVHPHDLPRQQLAANPPPYNPANAGSFGIVTQGASQPVSTTPQTTASFMPPLPQPHLAANTPFPDASFPTSSGAAQTPTTVSHSTPASSGLPEITAF